MSAHNPDRMGAAPLKSLNAFNLPKLKKFSSRPEQKSYSTQPTTDEAENIDTSHRSTSPTDLASPTVQRKSSQAPVSKPTTSRKSRRQAKSRPSEVTVYYDAVQSPDKASTVTKQKPRQARATKPSAKCAAAAEQHAAMAEPEPVSDTYVSDTQPDPMEADNHSLLSRASADPVEVSRKHKQQASCASANDLASVAAPLVVPNTSSRRRSSTDDNKPPAVRPAVTAPSQVEIEPQLGQQQHQTGKAAEGFSDGQEIFRYMQQLAENAAELLPQDDGQEQKKRGRGRAKKDLRLVDALHQSWQGKSYYERLQELTRQEIEDQEQAAAAAAGPEYKPMHLSQPAAAADVSGPDSTSQPQPHSSSQPEPGPDAAANGRKRRTARPKAGTADSDTDMDDADAATEATAQPKSHAAEAGGSSKRRATAGAAAAAGRAGPTVVTKGGKAAATGGAGTAAAANKARRSTAVAGAVATNKSPFVGSTAAGARPLSSRPNGNLAWESTPAAATAGSLPERPPWSVGGSAAATAAGAAIGTAGPAATAGTAKADRGAVQRLQAALEAKSDELTALKEQLKESQETIAKLRSEHKSHPKALAQLEKQKQALENKVEAVERKQTALERDNKGLQEKLAKQEAEKVTLQEQLSKSDKEVKALRLKLKQSTAKLEKCQTAALKLQEMCAGLAADSQPVWIE